MSRKHFQDIARVLKLTKASAETIEEMADMLAAHNPQFDRDRFIAAATA